MKINRLIKAFSLLLVVAFTACSDFEDTELLSPEKPAGNQGVFFPTTNATAHELEPTDPTQITVKVSRTVSSGAASIPLVVVTNDEGVFNVPATANFADGETETDIVVTFPDADEGITYKLVLAVEGDQSVDPYGEGAVSVATQVTRIKWEAISTPMIYVDGTFSALFGVSPYPMYVYAEKAVISTAVRYRFKNAYKVPSAFDSNGDAIPDADGVFDGYPFNDPGDFDESKDYVTIIEIDDPKGLSGSVYMYPHEIGVNWSYGMISIGSNGAKRGALSNGKITFPADAMFFSMAGYDGGAKYTPASPTLIYLTKEAFIKDNMRIVDFNDVEYVDIEGELGEFESLAYGETWTKTISQAIDIDSTNEASEYKNLFYLADLYAEGYGLAFYYDKTSGKVTIPESQKIGTKVFGQDLYVSQSDNNESSVVVNYKGTSIYTFGLTFHFSDGTIVGDFAETFYYSEEALTYTKEDFLGEFTLIGGSAPADVEIAEESPNSFVITGISRAEEVVAEFSPEDQTLSITPQELADVTLGEGEDAVTYNAVWYTQTPGGLSASAALEFEFDLRGNLIVSESSVGTGFRIIGYNVEDEDDAGYLNTNLNPAFIPVVADAEELELQSSVSLRSANKSGANFSIQGKISKDKKRNISRAF
ncbi:MAG: hypothetical protein KA433_05305 [Fermentimonas sp.]|jgi:hypothetical protein|nr:hypothetical protein [Fermentimonas sp.]